MNAPGLVDGSYYVVDVVALRRDRRIAAGPYTLYANAEHSRRALNIAGDCLVCQYRGGRLHALPLLDHVVDDAGGRQAEVPA